MLLPVSAFFLIFRYIAGVTADDVGNRVLLTISLVLIIYVVVAIFNAIFFGMASPESWRARTPKLLRDIILALLVMIGGGIVASQVWNQNVAGMLTALGIGSVILGFALQETLGNIMLGLSMLMERPYLEVDNVKIGGTEGRVEEINWRATRLASGADVIIIPHAIAAKEIITNYSRPQPGTQSSITLGFGYGHAPNHVKAMLLDVITTTDGVLKSPAPSVVVENFGDSAINYTISYSVAEFGEKAKVRDRFMTAVWYASQRSGVVIPYPTRTVYKLDEKDAFPDRLQKALSLLGDTTLLRGLNISTDSLDQWFGDAKLQHYAAGETVVRQGEQVPYLYVIVTGTAKIRCSAADRLLYDLYDLNRGEFFGEATLISGADSPYSVEAVSDIEILSLSKDDVHRLIGRKPSLAMEISQVMTARRKVVAGAGKSAMADAQLKHGSSSLTMPKRH